MKLRIDPETRDSLTFLIGLFGIISQGVISSFGVEPSIPMLGIYGTMIGIGVGGSIIKGQKSRGADDQPSPEADNDG